MNQAKRNFIFWLFEVLYGNVGQTASLSSANRQFTLRSSKNFEEEEIMTFLMQY